MCAIYPDNPSNKFSDGERCPKIFPQLKNGKLQYYSDQEVQNA